MDVAKSIKASTLAGIVIFAGAGIYEGTVSIGPVDSVAPNEVVSLRTEYSETFTADSLHWQTVSSRTPMHYRAEGETEWKKIDTSVKAKPVIKKLVAKITGGRQYEVNSGVYDAEFYGEGQEHNYRFERNGASIEYEATFDTTGVVFTVEPKNTGVKETLTLSEGATTRFSWTVTVTDGTIRPDGAGWVVINYDGVEAFRIPAVTAHGADGKPVRIVSALDGEILTAVIDTTGAIWPVTVDPSTVIATDTDDMTGFLMSTDANWTTARNLTTANGAVIPTEILTGTKVPTGKEIYRSLIRMNVGIIPNVVSIDSAVAKFVISYCYVPAGTINIRLCATDDTLSAGHFNLNMFKRFKGWAASGAYSPTYVSADSVLSTVSVGDTVRYKLNATGLANINVNSTIQFFALANNDISSTETGYASIGFGDDSPYMTVYYTAPAVNTEYTTTYTLENLKTHKVQYTTYGGARGENSYSYVTTAAIDTIGQKKSGSNYSNYRISFQTPTLNHWNVITSAKVILTGAADGSTTDFNLKLVKGTWDSADPAGKQFYDFEGWQTGLTPYTSTALNNTFSTSGFNAAGPDTLVLNSSGIAALIAASQDTARFLLISSRDIDTTLVTGSEFVKFSSTTPRLIVTWSLQDSVPASCDMHATSKDSIAVTWRDRTFDETGFYIVNANTAAIVDSVAANVDSLKIGGLATNTKYVWKIRVKGGVYADSVSAADSTYTYTVAAHVDSTKVVAIGGSNAYRIIYWDTTGTGNPDYTLYAFQDSIRAAQSKPAYIDPTVPLDTLRWTAAWRTRAQWSNKDTLKFPAGMRGALRVRSKSGE